MNCNCILISHFNKHTSCLHVGVCMIAFYGFFFLHFTLITQNTLFILHLLMFFEFSWADVPQFWTAGYFLAGILLLVNCQASHIVIMERTLIDSYPTLGRYRKYVTSVIYFTGCLLGVLLSSHVSNIILCKKQRLINCTILK